MCHYCDIEEITPELRKLLEPGETPPKSAFLANHIGTIEVDDLEWAVGVLKQHRDAL